MDDSQRHNYLLAQYDAVSDQIVHWDTFFWSKSQFFLAVESVAVLGVGNWFVERAGTSVVPVQGTSASVAVGLGLELFVIFAAAALLNLYLCVVWLRTGTRNRDFLNIRFEIGRKMEELLEIAPGLYTYQHWKVHHKGLTGPQSHRLEILMPVAFGVSWLGILGYLIAGYTSGWSAAAAVSFWGTFGLLVLLLLNEVRQSAVTPPPEDGGTVHWAEFEKYSTRTPPVS